MAFIFVVYQKLKRYNLKTCLLLFLLIQKFMSDDLNKKSRRVLLK